jgi:hypothetical protein
MTFGEDLRAGRLSNQSHRDNRDYFTFVATVRRFREIAIIGSIKIGPCNMGSWRP